MKLLRLALALVCLVFGVLAGPAAPAQSRVPQGFTGVVFDRGFSNPGFSMQRETRTMVAGGIESMRVGFQWFDMQPYERFADVPEAERGNFTDVEGVPTDFRLSDRLVAAAARRRLALLPAVTTAPRWASKFPGRSGSPPAGSADYSRLMRGLVRRYGPRGSYWALNPGVPRRPIRRWQIWNEPNLPNFWRDRTFAPQYVELVRAARRSILGIDGGAKIVLAGLTNRSWIDLAKIYRRPGARRLFDQVAVHPYTRFATDVPVIAKLVRRTMRRNGDARKPLLVTEFGWLSSAGERFSFETTPAKQAQRAATALRLLARQRRRLGIKQVYWYNWAGANRGFDPFEFAGLRQLQPDGTTRSKPAFRAYTRGALRLEDCARKSSVATRCARRAR